MPISTFTKLTPILSAILLMQGCLTMGCSIIDTGPQMTATVSEAASGAVKMLLQSYAPETMHVNVDGKVSDPRYTATVFVGAGTLVKIDLGIQGADLGFGITSAGGSVPVDAATRERLTAIVGNASLSEQERKDAIAAAVVEWLKSKTGNSATPSTEPPFPVAAPAVTPAAAPPTAIPPNGAAATVIPATAESAPQPALEPVP